MFGFRTTPVSEHNSGHNRSPCLLTHPRYAPCALFEPLGFPSRGRALLVPSRTFTVDSYRRSCLPCCPVLCLFDSLPSMYCRRATANFVIPFLAGGGLSRILILHFLVCPGTLCDHGRQTLRLGKMYVPIHKHMHHNCFSFF